MLQLTSSGREYGLVPNRWQAIVCTNDGLVYWCIYASFSLIELKEELASTVAISHDLHLSKPIKSLVAPCMGRILIDQY